MSESNREDQPASVSAGKNGEAPVPKAKTKITPLPKLKMVAVAATLLTESICTTMLLPFVGLYVAHLQNISAEEAGYFSGILIGLFMLGQVISTKLWGWLSDIYGRRLPLLTGLFAGAWTMLFFGMAPNIYVCCVMRFIHGFFNGNVLIAKIIVADITDSTNVAMGFSMISLMWGVGAVIGPAIGGLLYDPLENPSLQWMNVKEDSYLGQHPAFLASLVIFIYTLLSTLLCFVVLPETNPHRRGSLRTVPVIGWVVNWLRPKAVTIVETVESPVSAVEELQSKAPNMTYMKTVKDIVLRTLIIIVMCICVTDMAFVEIVPLWAIAPRDVGGLGFFSDGVGMLMLACSIPTFATNLLFAKVSRMFNNFTIMWEWSLALLIVATFLTPIAAHLSDGWAFWYVWVMGTLKNVACSSCFTIDQVLVSRAAPPGTLGAVYGITQSFGALVRCVVPFVVAPLFAWSISGGHTFPFNHYFVFYLTILPLFFAMYLCWVNPIERTPEELAAYETAAKNKGEASDTGMGDWQEAHGEYFTSTSSDGESDAATDAVSMVEYRSLASSFALNQNENVFAHLPALEAEQARKHEERRWARRTAPRGRDQLLHASAKGLQQEDWRQMVDERIVVARDGQAES